MSNINLAYTIIKMVASDHRITEREFFGRKKWPEYVRARVDAMRRMENVGMSHAEIGRMVRRHESTVAFHLLPGYRERRLRSMALRLALARVAA